MNISGSVSLILALFFTSVSYADSKVAVIGDNLSKALTNYANSTTLKRVDCDPTPDGRWICASFRNPTLSDIGVSVVDQEEFFVVTQPTSISPMAPPYAGQVKPTPEPTPEPECCITKKVSNRAEFLSAVNNIKNGTAVKATGEEYYIIELTNDINLDGATMVVTGLSNTIIDGDGYYFTRTTGQLSRYMFHMKNSSNVRFEEVGFDDGNDGVIGTPGKTPHMILIENSNNIVMDGVHVTNSKTYALYVRGVNGFTFRSSRMDYSGVLGLYVGHDDSNPSRNVEIDGNVFYSNSTNAVALLGVTGEVQNKITNNTFEMNHLYGRFAVAPKYGAGFTGGGQLYIAQADNVLISGNTIKNGYCSNCYHLLNNPNRTRLDVTGLELSRLKGDQIIVKRITITDNDIFNNNGGGISQNSNSTLDSTVRIYGNRVYDNGEDYAIKSAAVYLVK